MHGKLPVDFVLDSAEVMAVESGKYFSLILQVALLKVAGYFYRLFMRPG